MIFQNDPNAYQELGLIGEVPKSHINLIEAIKKFYTGLNDNEERKAKVAKLKITPEAFAAIELWMRDFYAVAKIALDDKVELMKALKG